MAAQVDVAEGYRGPQVCKIVGISYRQLDYWARTDLVRPSLKDAKGSGSQRLYSFQDLVHLQVIKKLLDAGVNLQQIREAIRYLSDELNAPLDKVTLLSDGRSIYAATSEKDIIDLLQKGQGVFGIALGPLYEDVQGTVRQIAPTGEAAMADDGDADDGDPPVADAAGSNGTRV